MFKRLIIGFAFVAMLSTGTCFSENIKVNYSDIENRVEKASPKYYSNLLNYNESKASSSEGPQSWEALELKKLNYEVEKNNLMAGVKNKFIQYKISTMEEQQLLNSHSVLSRKIESIRKKYNMGLIKKSELEEAEEELQESWDTYLNAVDKTEIEYINLTFSLGVTANDKLIVGDVPNLEREYVNNINLKQYITSIINNTRQTSILYYTNKNNASYHYDKLIRENEVTISTRNKYIGLKNSLKKLEKSEKKLLKIKSKNIADRKKYDKGLISKLELNASDIGVINQTLTVDINKLNLYDDIEGFKQLNF